MRALFLNRPGDIELRETCVPEPGTGEIVVRVRAATTCGTDLKAFRRGHPKIPMPGPFGHEWAGEIAFAGEGSGFTVGEAVMGVHTAPCGLCAWCARGQGNLCETIMETMVRGSYAEYLRIPARIASRHVFRKPGALPFSQAALLEPLASVAQGVLELRRTNPSPGNALVIGTGAIGLMWAAALRLEGWTATVAGRNPERLAAAERLQIPTRLLTDLRDREELYDLVVECTGQVEVWERAPDLVRRGGTCVLFGGPPGGTRASFDTHRLHYDQVALLSPFHFGTEAVILSHRWLTAEGLDLSALISGERSLEEATQVFADLEAGRGIKWAFVP